VEQAFMPAVLLLKKSASATEVSLSRYIISERALAVWSEATPKTNDPPVSLPRRLRVEPVDQFFSCQVLQLLRLETSFSEKVADGHPKLRVRA
jgi:hypothetical protein